MKKISVITINFNNAAGLENTVSSIVSQENANFEYIVIDGNSTDESQLVLEKYNSQISYWISEPDKGIYDAMNKGVLKAQGEYLLFINSGDRLFENATLKKAESFLGLNIDIVYGNLKIEEKGELTDGFMPDEISLSQMMKDTLWHPVSFIKKDLFTKFGLYDITYKICGDYDFFFKTIISKKIKTKHINQFIAVFDLNGISSDASNNPKIKEEKEAIRKKYLTEEEIENFWQREKEPTKTNFFTKWFR